MPFLLDPMGKGLVPNKDDHTMNTVEKPVKNFMDRSLSKVVTTDEAVKSFPDGKWFEFEIAAMRGGFLQEIAVGFTQTSPEELKVLNEADSFPIKADKLQNTWVAGYQSCCYLNGRFQALENNCVFDLALVGKSVVKETVGTLLATNGDLVIFKNRMEIVRVQAAEMGVDTVPMDKDLYGVIDIVGGVERVRLKSSVPPSKEEQAAAAAAAAAAKGKDDTKDTPAEAAPAATEPTEEVPEGEGGGE